MIKNDLEKIVGQENVLRSPDILEEFSGKSSVISPRTPDCIVRPANTDELQGIVKLANEHKVPLVPVSSGPPHFHGGTVPGIENAVIVDLRRMNKIIRINAANRVTIVEPGVTFGELQSELTRYGMSSYIPLLPRSSKSVLASVLERDPILMPGVHFDSTDPMLCTEIVFGTGDKMRTGEAAGPDALEQQWEIGKAQISPFGPTQMDPQRLVSGAQGTIGIVTWMSLKCRFRSELSRAYFIVNDSLEPLLELSYYLTRIRFTGNIFILNGLNLACLTRHNPAEIAALRGSLPPWVLFISFEGYGPLPEEKIKYLESDLKELSISYGLDLHTSVPGLKAQELANLLSRPSPEPYWKMRFKGDFEDIFFLTTQGKTPEFAGIISELATQQGFPVTSIGTYIQPVVQGTSCHCEFNLYFNPANQAELDLARKYEAIAVERLEEKGAFFSRPYKRWVNIAYRHAPDTVEMQKKVKNIFDPNRILNPRKLCF
jgi:hypothetical protein